MVRPLSDSLLLGVIHANAVLEAWRDLGAPLRGRWVLGAPAPLYTPDESFIVAHAELACTVCQKPFFSSISTEPVGRALRGDETPCTRTLEQIQRYGCTHLTERICRWQLQPPAELETLVQLHTLCMP